MLPSDASKNPDARIIVSGALDPALNLAAEELLFEQVGPECVWLLIYRNDRSVVIGKHQNPWRECSTLHLSRARVPVFRRISGGGTVYHDPGNLNFSFLVAKSLFDKKRELELVLRGLEHVGITGNMNDRGDLLVDGRKISGNALAIKRHRVLHHGTLLVNADLQALRGSARSGGARFETHAVASQPATVVNLSQIRPQITTDLVVQGLIRAFREAWGSDAPLLDSLAQLDRHALEEVASRHGTWEWVYGSTPRFTVAWDRVRMTVENGVIVDVEGEDGGVASQLLGAFARARFDIDAVEERLKRFSGAVPL